MCFQAHLQESSAQTFSLYLPAVCQVLRFHRCTGETFWRWAWAASRRGGGGRFFSSFFLLELDFIFVHSETSILSCNPVLPLNFHLTVWKLEWYKDVSFRLRRQSAMAKRRAREWQKIETVRYRGKREIEARQGSSTQISGFPEHSSKCLDQIFLW